MAAWIKISDALPPESCDVLFAVRELADDRCLFYRLVGWMTKEEERNFEPVYYAWDFRDGKIDSYEIKQNNRSEIYAWTLLPEIVNHFRGVTL